MGGEQRPMTAPPAQLLSRTANCSEMEASASSTACLTEQIIRVDPRSAGLWQRLVQDQKSSVFHSPEWLYVLSDTYGFQMAADVLVDDGGSPIAGIPYCYVSDLRGERLVTLPFSDYCDPLVSNSDEWQALTTQIPTGRVPYLIRCLHNTLPLEDQRFTCFNRAKWHGVDLNADIEMLWQNLHPSARRAIRKAERLGVTVRQAHDMEDLRKFYELHLRVRKQKYHMLAQPYRFFEHIWRQFIAVQRGALLIAEYEGNAIGATIYLAWQGRLYYKFNASDPGGLSFRPNDLLAWSGMKYAHERRYRFLDFGLSDWDQEGLVRYKRKFASEEKTISFLRYRPDEALQSSAEFGALLPHLTDLFTDENVPDHITEKAGELLYRFFT